MHTAPDDGRIEFRPAPPLTPGAARLDKHRSDASIRAEIVGALARASWLDLREVVVFVHRGEVLFDGEVADRRLRAALYEVAARVRGVRAVHDCLRLSQALARG